MLHNYQLFGLTVESEVTLPGLATIANKSCADVSIHFGCVPQQLERIEFETDGLQVSFKECLLNVEDIGRIWIIGGKKIVVEPSATLSHDSLHLFLTGTAISTILKQRGYMILHASANKIGEHAVVFLGERGLGKSTLASYLSHRGHALLSDDICAVRITQDGCELTPSFPRAKLSAKSVSLLPKSISMTKPLLAVGGGSEKVFFPSPCYWENPIKVSAFLLLTSSNLNCYPDITLVEKMRRLKIMQTQVYRNQISIGTFGKRQYFESCASLITKAPVFELNRSLASLELKDIENILIQKISSIKQDRVG